MNEEKNNQINVPLRIRLIYHVPELFHLSQLGCLKKNLSASKTSNESKVLVGNIGCRDKSSTRRCFQYANFIPIVGVGKTGAYQLVHGNLPRQHLFGTTLRFTGPVPADSRQ